ncbi:MAG: hypothetical protein ACQEP5_08215 [Actinomycetota bacterium]
MHTKASKITFPYLRRFNGAMAALHLIQAVLMLVMGLTVANIKDFRLPFTVSFLTYDRTIGSLVTETRNIGSLPIGAMVSIFLFLSAIAHFLVVLPGVNYFYNERLKKGINYFRWLLVRLKLFGDDCNYCHAFWGL